MYNLTNLTDAETILETAIAVNELTGQMYAVGVLVCLYFVLLAGFSKYPFKTNLLATSFIMTVISLVAWGSQLIDAGILIYPMILTCIGMIYYKFSE